MPTEQMRSRCAAAGYQLMQIEEAPIAKNMQEFMDHCLKLCSSKSDRESLRQQILSKRERLFKASGTLAEMRQFIVDAIECSNEGRKLDINWSAKSTCLDDRAGQEVRRNFQ